MPLINCEINLQLKWPSICVITDSTDARRFTIIDTKLYVPVVTLSTRDNAKLLQQLKSGLKRTINWNKYQSKISTERQNLYLDYLTDPSFQEVNIIFVLPFENENDRTAHTGDYLPKVEIKDYNVKTDSRNFFDQPINDDIKTYENTGQRDDYTTGCLSDYPYFKENYKMIAIDLNKQQVLDADPRAIQLINFTANLKKQQCFLFLKKQKKLFWTFHKEL